MIFVVGSISTTHYQATLGEYVYAYVRLQRSLAEKSYLISHADRTGFGLYFRPENLSLKVAMADPVPIRIRVLHNLSLAPKDMGQAGFDCLASTIIQDTCKEISGRVPKRSSCHCVLGNDSLNCRFDEFTVEGLIRPD